MSLLYSVKEASKATNFNYETFVFAAGSDERALAMLRILGERENRISKVLLLKYDSFDEKSVLESLPAAEVIPICINDDASSFLMYLSP